MKISNLLKRNSVYAAIQPTMLHYQNSYLGGLVFKASVRQKRPSEDAKLYQDTLQNTAALPIARYIVEQLNQTVFSQEIDRELEFVSPDGMELEEDSQEYWTELFCYDADLQNRSLHAFMELVGELSSIFGHCWVAVDMDNDVNNSAARPYTVAISPLSVLDWQFALVNGKSIPAYVKILEYEDNEVYRFKCYYLGTTTKPSYWESYLVNKRDNIEGNIEPYERGTYPPGMALPLFIAYTRRDPRFNDLGISDIDSASDVQREVYKMECEAYGSIQFARTLIRAEPNIAIPALSGGVVRAAEGQVEVLPIDTQDVPNIISKQTDLIDNLETLSGYGGLRKHRNEPQSGISIIEERKGLHRMAASKARELETVEEMIWTFAARFMGVRWAGEVVYGTNYEQSDTKLKIAKLQLANQLSGSNPVIRQLIDENVLELLVEPEDYEEYKNKMRSLPIVTPDGTTTTLQEEDSEEDDNMMEVETRDLGDQTPKKAVPLKDENDTSVGIGVTVGQPSYNPVATMLLNTPNGR